MSLLSDNEAAGPGGLHQGLSNDEASLLEVRVC